MGRLMAIDYGKKRVGIAVSDPLKIVANALETVAEHELMKFLETYFSKEKVEAVVVGLPLQLNAEPSENYQRVEVFVRKFKERFPEMPVHRVDERFTSSMAMQAMIDGGMKKKDRQVKANVDKISATIILQTFMNSIV